MKIEIFSTLRQQWRSRLGYVGRMPSNCGLTHYTSIEAVSKILGNGFAWMPNKRNLMKCLVPAHDFSKREPQEFGMISFTDRYPPASEHLKEFGRFGIVVSYEWAQAQDAQRVLYLSCKGGPLITAFEWLFTTGYEQLRAKINPNDGAALMAFTNKEMAGIQGGLLWNQLLTIYEYMEPTDHAYQSEWRIVHPKPMYGYPTSKSDVIQNVSPPEDWAKYCNVLRAPADAVVGFVCPREDEQSFVKDLPPDFRSKQIWGI
jgi:hypothetical protein